MNKQQISSKYKNKNSWFISLDIKQSFNILFYMRETKCYFLVEIK